MHTFSLTVITQERRIQHNPVKLPLERHGQPQRIFEIVVGKLLKQFEAVVELE